MSKLDPLEDARYVFAMTLIVANRMDTLLDRELRAFDVTAKQWLLSAAVSGLFDEPPTIKEVAREMGSSHQNIKQVALKLEQKGLLKLEKDKKDARATRLKTTDKSDGFWSEIQPKGTKFIEALFRNVKTEDLSRARNILRTMVLNLASMEDTDMNE